MWFSHHAIKVYLQNLTPPIWHELLKQHRYLGLSAVVALATLMTFSVTYAIGIVLGSVLLPYLDIMYHNLSIFIPNFFNLWSDIWSENFNSSCCYWVAHCHCAVCRGHVVGLMAAKRMRGDKLELIRTYVSPSVRGLGLATKLCKIVLEFAKENGYSEIHLETLVEFTPAVNLYQKSGYSFTHSEPFPYSLFPIPTEIGHFWRPVKKISDN